MPDDVIRIELPADGTTIAVVHAGRAVIVSVPHELSYGIDEPVAAVVRAVQGIAEKAAERQQQIYELPRLLLFSEIQEAYAGTKQGKDRNAALARARRTNWTLCMMKQVRRYCFICSQQPGSCQHNLMDRHRTTPSYCNNPGDWTFALEDVAGLIEADLAGVNKRSQPAILELVAYAAERLRVQ